MKEVGSNRRRYHLIFGSMGSSSSWIVATPLEDISTLLPDPTSPVPKFTRPSTTPNLPTNNIDNINIVLFLGHAVRMLMSCNDNDNIEIE